MPGRRSCVPGDRTARGGPDRIDEIARYEDSSEDSNEGCCQEGSCEEGSTGEDPGQEDRPEEEGLR